MSYETNLYNISDLNILLFRNVSSSSIEHSHRDQLPHHLEHFQYSFVCNYSGKVYFHIAKLSSSWLVQSSSAELRFALYLIITTHPPPPQNSSDFYGNKHSKATGSSEGLIGCFGGSFEVEWGV